MQRSHLIIDEGNTCSKFAIVENGRITDRATADNDPDLALSKFVDNHTIGKIISSSTRRAEVQLPKQIIGIPHIRLSPNLKLPVTLNYKTPETLGCDRIAAAAGAVTLFPGKNTLIIDIGTAITVDFVTADAVFEGGIISPGPAMRAKALNYFTGKLPLTDIVKNADLQGKNTVEAIQFGINNGVSFEISGYIESYRKITDNLNVILTGGYSLLFKRADCQIEPDLVIFGMNRILEIND